jgi:hypothetical protein
MEQGEYSNTLTGSYGSLVNLGALYQNVSESVTSTFLFDLDYNSDQTVPVNYGAVTYSISQSQVNNYAAYTNPNNAFAEVQDSNYYFTGIVKSRYEGAKNYSLYYNTYSTASNIVFNGTSIYWPGDSSYGTTAAIDKIKYQYAYIVNMFSASFQMPNRAKGQIKYLIDNNENVINLSKNNNNLFSVQNIFKSGEWADVSLFDYDPNNPYIQKLNNSDNDFTIWESGYSYSPLIYNPSGSLTYVLNDPIIIPGTGGSSGTTVNLNSSDRDYWLTFNSKVLQVYSGVNILQLTGSSITGPAPTTAQVTVTYYVSNGSKGRWPASSNNTLIIPAGTTPPYQLTVTNLGSSYDSWAGDTPTVVVLSETTGSSGTPATPPTITYTATEPAAFWRVASPGNLILISVSQSLYYNQFTSTGSYSGLDAFVFPFQINPNDLIRLYNVSTSRWDQSGEFRVANVNTNYTTQSINYVALTLDRTVPIEYTVSSSNYPLKVEKYILLKRIEDETSLYFNYNLVQSIPQDGTLFPQYIGDGIKEGSGNVIKALKQQNLI